MPMEPQHAQFPTTQWADFALLRAGRQAGTEALERLCKAYWFPLYAFARRRGYSPELAEDLTQDFYWHAISKDFFERVQPTGGRFRSFLLTSFQHFLHDKHKYDQVKSRRPPGGWVNWDQETLEERYLASASGCESPEQEFNRRWALTILDRAFTEIEAEFAARNQSPLGQHLVRFLRDEPGVTSHAEAARAFGTTESAIKSEMHRLKARLRDRIKDQVARTVTPSSEIGNEIEILMAALGGSI